MIKKLKKKIKLFLKSLRGFYYKRLGYVPVNYHGHHLKLNVEQFQFWERASKKQWEPETFNVLSKFLKPDSVYLDIGAWIGPTVIYASKLCKKVICFEPDPIAYKHLLTNIQRNNLTNISTFNLAISNKTTIQTISNFGGNVGNSMSTLLKNEKSTPTLHDVLVLDWDFVQSTFGLQDVSMIKIDIEGGEFTLIPELAEYLKKNKPVLWLSLHAPFLDDETRMQQVNNLIEVLCDCYETCLNSNLEAVNIKNLSDNDIMKGFPEFLFK